MLTVAFLIAFVTGVLEMLLLNAVLKNALGGNTKKTVLFILLKLVLYVACIASVMLLFKADITKAALGFAFGLPGAAIAFAVSGIIKNKKEGDGACENRRDN